MLTRKWTKPYSLEIIDCYEIVSDITVQFRAIAICSLVLRRGFLIRCAILVLWYDRVYIYDLIRQGKCLSVSLSARLFEKPVHIKLFLSACWRTLFNEHHIFQICDDRSSWNWKSVKAQILASHFSSSTIIRHRTAEIFCVC